MNSGLNTASNEVNDVGTHNLLGMPDWVGYTFGTLFILLGITLMFMYKKTKTKSDDYRRRQLIEFNKNRKRKITDYSQTGMFLPPWEKAKLFGPVLFGMTFIILGIAWMAGQTLFSM